MSQSGFIAGALLAGFVLYVAAKGRLTTYTDVLWGPTTAPLPQFSIPFASVGTAVAGALNSALDTVQKNGSDTGKSVAQALPAITSALIT